MVELHDTVVFICLYLCEAMCVFVLCLLRLPRTCNARRLSVCLFVCLLAILCKNYQIDLHENFTTDVSVHKEELIEFWKSSASGSGHRNFLKDSSTYRDRHFSTIWLISPERVIGFSLKFHV